MLRALRARFVGLPNGYGEERDPVRWQPHLISPTSSLRCRKTPSAPSRSSSCQSPLARTKPYVVAYFTCGDMGQLGLRTSCPRRGR